MGPTPIFVAGGAALAAAVLAPAAVHAQWNNEPYQFRSNIGGSAGMSMAYRQAMLNEELFGRRPDNLVRGADGRLLEVFRRDQQAFLAEPEPNFLVGGRRTGTGLFIGGVGLGVQTPVGAWTAIVDVGPAAGYGWGGARSPIDGWIGMLD